MENVGMKRAVFSRFSIGLDCLQFSTFVPLDFVELFYA